jgi:hypothetical protein
MRPSSTSPASSLSDLSTQETIVEEGSVAVQDIHDNTLPDTGSSTVAIELDSDKEGIDEVLHKRKPGRPTRQVWKFF